MKFYLSIFALLLTLTQSVQIKDSIRYCSVLDQDPCEALYQICNWNTMEGVCESQQLRNLAMTSSQAEAFVAALNSDEFPYAEAYTSTSDSAELAASLQAMDDDQGFAAHVFVKYAVYNQYTIASIVDQLNLEANRSDLQEYQGDLYLAQLSSETSDQAQIAQALKYQSAKYFLTLTVAGMNPVQFATAEQLLGAEDSAQIVNTLMAMDSKQILQTKQDLNILGILGYTDEELDTILQNETPSEIAGDLEVTRLASSATISEIAAGLQMFAGNYAAGLPIRKTTEFVLQMHPEELQAAEAFTSTSTESQLATVFTMMDANQLFATHVFVKYSAFNGYTLDQAIAQLNSEPPKELAGDAYLAHLPTNTTNTTEIAIALKKESQSFLVNLKASNLNYVQYATAKAYLGATDQQDMLNILDSMTPEQLIQTVIDLNQLGLLNYSDNELIDILKSETLAEYQADLQLTGLNSNATYSEVASALKSVAAAYASANGLQSRMVSVPVQGPVATPQQSVDPSNEPINSVVAFCVMIPGFISSLLIAII